MVIESPQKVNYVIYRKNYVVFLYGSDECGWCVVGATSYVRAHEHAAEEDGDVSNSLKVVNPFAGHR